MARNKQDMPADDMAMDTRPKRSGNSEKRYVVRQVTNIQASWQQADAGEEGEFTLQLILDNGAEEHILSVDSDDIDPLLKLFSISSQAMFDMDRKVLMFGTLSTK